MMREVKILRVIGALCGYQTPRFARFLRSVVRNWPEEKSGSVLSPERTSLSDSGES